MAAGAGLVAAGGLAAALSTADGLLLTISNALVRDLYFQERQRLDTRKRRMSPEQRVILSKFALLLVALSAAFVAARRSSDILPMVSASFSLAGSAFVPAMVLGIFWRGTTRRGAVAGMLLGLYPPAALLALAAWALTFLLTRTSSLASLIATPLTLPLLAWQQPEALLPMCVLTGLIVWRHRGNLRDLFAGRERHF